MFTVWKESWSTPDQRPVYRGSQTQGGQSGFGCKRGSQLRGCPSCTPTHCSNLGDKARCLFCPADIRVDEQRMEVVRGLWSVNVEWPSVEEVPEGPHG